MSKQATPDISVKDSDHLPLRVGLGQFMEPTDKRLEYIRQLGVEDVILNMYQYDSDYAHIPQKDSMPLESKGGWSYEQLVALRKRINAEGLRLNAIENIPISFYDDVMLGGPQREEQIEQVKQIIRNIGRAGIPMFGYHWSPTGVARTGTVTLDGGATASSYRHSTETESIDLDRRYTETELWENYERFLKAVIPVAEEADVKLCLHPNDPPVPTRGGVPQLFRNFDNIKRAMDFLPSDNHGLDLCLGTWSQMGAELPEIIRYFGERDKIYYVHFRDVVGTVPSFHETWIDQGNYDALEVMKELADVGFSGLMIPDHTPHIDDDTDWDHRGRAYTTGYLKALLRCVCVD